MGLLKKLETNICSCIDSITSKFIFLVSNIFKKITTSYKNRNKGLFNLFHAIILGLVVFIILGIWVHKAHSGNYWGVFWPGSIFGVPEAVAEEQGVFPTSSTGWDAQFYYYQANDLKITKATTSHIDNPAYRYQKIGIPLLAGTISKITGNDTVSPLFYNILQLIIFTCGFYYLLAWLTKNKRSVFWAYSWVISVGVSNAIAHGMPDPACDALFIIAIVSAFNSNIWAYSLSSVILCLTREGYVAFACMILFFTFFNKIKWRKDSWLLNIILTAIAPVSTASWAIYVAIRTGVTYPQATEGFALSEFPPFLGFITMLHKSFTELNLMEVIFKLFALTLFLLIFILLLRHIKNVIWFSVFVYILLLTTLGGIIWENYSGYMKALGSVIAIGILLIAILPKKQWLKYKNIASVIFIILSFQTAYSLALLSNNLYYKYMAPSPNSIVMQEPLKSHDIVLGIKKSDIENITNNFYSGIFRAFHQEVFYLPVEITNSTGSEISSVTANGENIIDFGYNWFNESGEKVETFVDIRTPLMETVNNNATNKQELRLTFPKEPGIYNLEIFVVEEGIDFFNNYAEKENLNEENLIYRQEVLIK